MKSAAWALLAAAGCVCAQAPADTARKEPAPGLTCIAWDAAPVHTIRFDGFCDGWKAWKDGDHLTLVCPGKTPPAGAVELREYYVFPKGP